MESAPTTLRRTQSERRDAAQKSLMEATLAVIAESGVSSATFEAIGRRAGYSRGLATQHFGSKRGLIEAVIDHLHEQQEAGLKTAHLDDLNGLEALVAYVRQFGAEFERSRELHAYFMLLSDAVSDLQDTRAAFAQSHERVKGILAGFIKRGQQEGCVRADVDAEGTALMAGCLLFGASMQAQVDPQVRISPVCEELAGVLLRSLAPPDNALDQNRGAR